MYCHVTFQARCDSRPALRDSRRARVTEEEIFGINLGVHDSKCMCCIGTLSQSH